MKEVRNDTENSYVAALSIISWYSLWYFYACKTQGSYNKDFFCCNFSENRFL